MTTYSNAINYLVQRIVEEVAPLRIMIFGSAPRGEIVGDSDVDLFVIGDVGLRKISEFLSGVSEIIGREINPHVMTPHEFQNRVKSGDHFITTILNSPRLFIIGTENDFETMGR